MTYQKSMACLLTEKETLTFLNQVAEIDVLCIIFIRDRNNCWCQVVPCCVLLWLKKPQTNLKETNSQSS